MGEFKWINGLRTISELVAGLTFAQLRGEENATVTEFAALHYVTDMCDHAIRNTSLR